MQSLAPNPERGKTMSPAGPSADADVQVIAAAVADGRISASSSSKWLSELNRNREGTLRVLGALSPCKPASGPTATTPADPVDAECEYAYEQILGHPHAGAARQPLSPPPAIVGGQSERRSEYNYPSQRSAVTDEEMNRRLYADEEMHRAAWAMGIHGIKPPPPRLHWAGEWHSGSPTNS